MKGGKSKEALLVEKVSEFPGEVCLWKRETAFALLHVRSLSHRYPIQILNRISESYSCQISNFKMLNGVSDYGRYGLCQRLSECGRLVTPRDTETEDAWLFHGSLLDCSFSFQHDVRGY